MVTAMKRGWNYIAPYVKQYLAPLAKSALSAITDEGLEVGQKILSDVKKGANVKQAILAQGTEGVENLMKKGASQLQKMQKGSGRKRPRKSSLDTYHLVGRSVPTSAAKRGRRAITQGLY